MGREPVNFLCRGRLARVFDTRNAGETPAPRKSSQAQRPGARASETSMIDDPRMDTAGENEPDENALPKPKTLTVLGLLSLTSLTFSYLGAYAVSGALVKTEVLRPWPPGSDPRPKWLLAGFCVLLLTFTCVGGFVRTLSRRHLARIDDMANDEAVP